MEWFLTSNSASARVARTIAQGILALVPGVINFYLPYMPEWVGIIAAPIIMAILAPIMAELGKAVANDSTVAMTD